MNKVQEKIRYKTRNVRMDDRTWDKLKGFKVKSGVSWNKFLLDLVDKKKSK